MFRYKKMKRSFHTNSDILKDRLVFGEFYHLYNQLRNNDVLFRSYTRMTVETFDYLVEMIRPEFDLKYTNFQDPIPIEERLVVTIR